MQNAKGLSLPEEGEEEAEIGGCADRARKLCLTSVQAAHGAIREPASEAGRWQLDLLPRFLPRKPCLLYHNNLSGGCWLRDFSGLKPTTRQPRGGCSLRAAPGDVSADSCPGKNWCSLNVVTTLNFCFLCGHLPADSTCNSPSKRRPIERKRGQQKRCPSSCLTGVGSPSDFSVWGFREVRHSSTDCWLCQTEKKEMRGEGTQAQPTSTPTSPTWGWCPKVRKQIRYPQATERLHMHKQ